MGNDKRAIVAAMVLLRLCLYAGHLGINDAWA